MPNIIGNIYGDQTDDPVGEPLTYAENRSRIVGAFSVLEIMGNSGYMHRSQYGDGINGIGFDAENGRKYWHQNKFGSISTDVIYGNSQTVQPPAVTINFYIKAK